MYRKSYKFSLNDGHVHVFLMYKNINKCKFLKKCKLCNCIEIFYREKIKKDTSFNSDKFKLIKNNKGETIISFKTKEEQENELKEKMYNLNINKNLNFKNCVKKVIKNIKYKKMILTWRNYNNPDDFIQKKYLTHVPYQKIKKQYRYDKNYNWLIKNGNFIKNNYIKITDNF